MNSELLLDALRLSAVGMGVVFAALYVLSLLMYSLPLLAGGRAKPAPETEAAAITTASVAESAAASTAAPNGPTPEVIAVLATAIAAYLGQSPENLNIIAIRRAPAAAGPWALAARRESIQN